MMVTFVSQCEKNALKKTRRVLDAFANRIGDNTWQTVITEDGLITVKKMLRQTASKSTAVSCHWIRSRARSQFLWVVGNKNKFNSEGVVAVNRTEIIEVKMDEKRMNQGALYANTQKQPLAQHLFAVGKIAEMLIEKQAVDGVEQLKQTAFIAGCLHDVGKTDPEYSNWLISKINNTPRQNETLLEDGSHIDKGKFSFDKHPRHNEISLWLLQFVDLSSVLSNKKQSELIEHSVYWHHAKPFRTDGYVNMNDIHRKLKTAYKEKGLSSLVSHAKLVFKEVCDLAGRYSNNYPISTEQCKFKYCNDIASSFRKQLLPDYKQYDVEDDVDDYIQQVTFNAKANLVRSCVISADRQVSSLTLEQLQQHIDNKSLNLLVDQTLDNRSILVNHISNCIAGFDQRYPNSERNKKQAIAASQLLNTESIAVLNGPAGCGKTKIALEWAKLSEATKIIWVCPRVQVCEGLYRELTAKEYLPNAKIEICTGEVKESTTNGIVSKTEIGQEFSGEIVLTTIDQIINSITTHCNVTALVDFMNCHVVFDEYHEYIPMPAFNLLFAELIKCKKLKGNKAHTLLVSATPNYSYLELLLELETEDIIDIVSFNLSRYSLTFLSYDESIKDQTNPLFTTQSSNSIVISNTATTAQQAFILNQRSEDALLFHGKFKMADKQALFDKVYDNFKQNRENGVDILRSGPIVQASLNITCNRMVTEFTLAENWLQRLGRLDRFGENNFINQYVTAVPSEVNGSNGKIKGNCARFLNGSHCYRSAYAWYEFLQDRLTETTYSINQIYSLYKDFYKTNKGQDAVEQDLLASLKDSVKVINAKVHDPLRFVKKVKATDKKKLKKSSLRGDSRFVQMAVLSVNDKNDIKYLNQYAVDWKETNTDFSNCYTESLQLIRNSGLLDYVAKKHGRIDENTPMKSIPVNKLQLRKQVLEGAAIDPENPIYLSYTPDDIQEHLGETEADEAAIYYIKTDKQVVGAMPILKIKEL